MDVQDGKAGEEPGREEMHVPGADDELDAVPGQPVGDGGVAFIAVRVLLEWEGAGGHAGTVSPVERVSAAAVGGDRDDGESRVEQRLEVRALPGGEDPITALGLALLVRRARLTRPPGAFGPSPP